MTRLRFKAILSAVSVTALLLCVIMPVGTFVDKKAADSVTVPARITAAANEPAVVNTAETMTVSAATEKAAVESLDTEQLTQRFLHMLNLNRCFNSALQRNDSLVKSVAVSLSDYAQDKVGYGLCVSSYLIQGFIESFYGIRLDIKDITDADAPEGYISLPCMEMEFECHTAVSVTETEDGYEVLTCMRSYSGGEEYDTCLVKSKFTKNSRSEFGYNLVYCETL